jgi:hypothetical protein
MELYLYAGIGFLVGLACEQWRLRWRILAAISGVASGILINNWSILDWNAGRILRPLLYGAFWDVSPSTLFFVGPLLVGFYARRLVGVIVRWRRRQA